MTTEGASARYFDLDGWESADVLQALWEGQLAAVAAIGPALPALAAAAEAAEAGLRREGRLVYVGAGTSGRIGVQDGAELPPTFDWPEERLGFAIAGGTGAILQAVENAEDSTAAGAAWIAEADVGPNDVVVGLSASGTTPFTLAALKAARGRDAVTVGIANNPGTPILQHCTHPILVATGEEVVAGSTRLKAGTAQKVVLNLLSTLIMIRLGRVYRGRMIAMRATNQKLRARGVAMVAELAGCDAEAAARASAEAEGDIKLAVLIAAGAARDEAERLLARHDGNLRRAIAASEREAAALRDPARDA
ncbi:N-acetylmuramic acid 6-phosphate etherase [Methylobacterium crusticola]|uniref:N-acetylmuramic acid 6-phosphate etherase n=1 Tax=Methylobacterium crusticola TaxID=1697972 RepID=A0ABQ4QYN0_9HYPH|nr:N-acetylmuramic acid 6-phosphate etherase [Methylobacterium crusticola]GJD49672.1 N-acetylmuramic acid 6-phosphate etherase [Methylobacterium crusticola]